MKWLNLIASVPKSWKVETRKYVSNIEDTCTPLIPQSKCILLLDMSVKDDRAFSLLHQELPKILVLCFP